MIQIRDEAGLLSSADLSSLQAAAGRWPFEVHVLASTSSPNRAAFESRVSHGVDGPNVVSIGVDPQHHMTIVHFGNGTGVPASQWATISTAGNGDFRSAHWADGIAKIGDQTVLAKQVTQTVTLQPTTTVVAHHASSQSHVGLWILGGVVLLGALYAIYIWRRNKRREEAHRARMEELDAEIAEKRSRNIEEAGWTDKFRDAAPTRGYSRPAYAAPAAPSTVVVNNGGNGSNDLLTGYVIGSALSQPHVVERDVIIEREVAAPVPAPSYDSSSSSSDSGGSSSSWDSGSSSYDSGGSSSSFDSGGGGFDSGGGGGDW